MSLQDRLQRFLERDYPRFHASGELQRIVATETDYVPRTAVRRLEELAEDGIITVEIRKGHAWYAAKQPYKKPPVFIQGVGTLRPLTFNPVE